MRGVAVKTINQATTLRNWIIGCYIVEYEQNGSDRAKYGDNLLKSPKTYRAKGPECHPFPTFTIVL